MSRCLDLMNAVAAKIAAGTFTESFTPTVEYDAEYSVKDIDTLRVIVSSGTLSSEFATRAHRDRTYTIEIGILSKLDNGTNTEADRYVSLAEALDDWLTDPTNRTLTAGGGKYSLSRVETDPILDGEMLRDHRVAGSLLRATYKRVLG